MPESDWLPLDPEDHAAQLAAVMRLAHGPPRAQRILDLGAGTGRLATPLAQRGHDVCAIDLLPEALERIEHTGVQRVHADILDASLDLAALGSFHGALCLGHTFMLFHDVERALDLMRRVRRAILPGGWLAIDHFSAQVWRQIADGDWQTGLSDDDEWQFIWTGDDNTAVIRYGPDVRPNEWDVREDDRVLRLWTPGELALLAHASGFAPPSPDPTGALLIFSAPSAG